MADSDDVLVLSCIHLPRPRLDPVTRYTVAGEEDIASKFMIWKIVARDELV